MTNTAAALALPAALVELPKLDGVTFDETIACSCNDAECFFCGARNDALYAAYAEEEMAEWHEKHHCGGCDRAWAEAYNDGSHCRDCGTCFPWKHVEWCEA